MSKEKERLSHLLEKMSLRYGEQDEQVLRLREAVHKLSLEEQKKRAPLRYTDASMFADRATRLARYRSAAERWGQ